MRQPTIFHANLRLISLALWLLVCQQAAVADAEVAELDSPVGPSPVELIEALDQLQSWINADPENGQRWNRYLKTDLLRGEIDRGAQADPYVVVQILRQYQSEAHGLDRPQFVAVRTALESWYSALKEQHSADLVRLAWVSRGDFQPLTPERFAPIRDELRDRAQRLEASLNTNPARAANWKRYLKWELLQPHFDVGVQLNRQALKDLDLVLKRFRANQPGLELPMFTSTAEALQRYRKLALWAALAKSRDTRPLYERTIQGLQVQLERHLETATPETSWKIGKAIDLIEQLRCSPEFIASVRFHFGQPNLLISASAETLNQLAQRPVQRTKPIRDVILGAQVRGSADTVGQVSFTTLPADDHIELAVHFEGQIVSRTVAHKKPVRVTSRGRTNFVADKRLLISDDQFQAIPAAVVAQTRTNIRSIHKTGGPFAAKLIERIAWKKVCKSKARSEKIASRKAERKVGSSLDEELLEKLVEGRSDYDRLIRLPLIRRGAHPEHLQMTSTDSQVRLQSRLATSGQLSSSSRGPATSLLNELTIQVHQSALDNYLPLVLAGITIRQTSADEPPELIGDLPPWLRELTLKKPETDDAGAIDSSEDESADEIEAQTDSQPLEQADEQQSFTPGYITLNAERPISITFDDQNISIRIRAAEMQADGDSEEEPYKNWDFIVTYRIERDGNGILLKRTGRIEVFPTGFDPRWDKKLSGKQAGFRTTLANNLNDRAERGEGFPEEISLEPIRLPLFGGMEVTLVLEQLECDDGWLTVGWRLP